MSTPRAPSSGNTVSGRAYLGLDRRTHYLHQFTGTMLWQCLTAVPPGGNVSMLADATDPIAAKGN